MVGRILRHTLHRLTALSIARAKTAGYVADGGGLYMQVTATGARSWIFRFQLDKRRREMGLGPFPEISLAVARNLAQDARTLVKAGKDPIAERDALRARRRLEDGRSVTWDKAVEQFLADHEPTWRNAKHRQQWRSSLQTYASPVLGKLSPGAIGTPEVIRVLQPIWAKWPATAGRLRGRIERIWDWCKVRGYAQGENPARWRGHLDKVFPARRKLRKVRHHPAVPIDSLPSVYQRLQSAEGVAALATRFTILTAARPSQTTGARWHEIDRQAALWTVPASRMKGGKEHRVPLSEEALSILDTMAEPRTGVLIFPGRRVGRPLSLDALAKALRIAGAGKATTHGTARSTFKDWASERTTFANEVSEMALAHSIGDETEAAYRRGELLRKRAQLMEAWSRFLLTPPADGNVVPIGRRKAATSPHA
jgi:integrase